jgi:hypothetical protein
LERDLCGLHVGIVRERSLGYVDDVSALGSDVKDLPILDRAVTDYEAVSGAILNRTRKSVIVGLGAWAGRQNWPLPWLESVDGVKVFGVTFTPVFAETLAQSWDRVAAGVEQTLLMWAGRRLPTLRQRAMAIETFAFSKVWYMAQILPLPQAVAARLEKAAANFLWAGRLERLAWSELHGRLDSGGLQVSCVFSRGQALFAKQACHLLAAGGRPAGHLAYWFGLRLLAHLPLLGTGPHAEDIPPLFRGLSALLLEVFGLDSVKVANLGGVTAKALYLDFTETAPTPKIQSRITDIPWRIAWSRLATTGLPGQAVDVVFAALHNILPLQVRRHRMGLAPNPSCLICGALVEDFVHCFSVCPTVAVTWVGLATRIAIVMGGPLPDRTLLMLAWPFAYAPAVDRHVTLAIVVFMEMAWEARGGAAITLGGLKARVAASATPLFRSIF